MLDNRGKITVFLTLITICLLSLGLTAIRVVELEGARVKSVICAKRAISEIKAGFNPYIFEKYHILLFDKGVYGEGDAGLEQQLQEYFDRALGEKYTDTEVAISGLLMPGDNDCEPFKQQIADYMLYGAIEGGAEKVLDLTDGKDGSLSENILNDMDEAERTQTDGQGVQKEADDNTGNAGAKEDPRKFTKKIKKNGILAFVVPEGMELSESEFDPGTLSVGHKIYNFSSSVDLEFDSFSDFKKDVRSYESWLDSLKNAGSAVFYANNVFNNALDTDVNTETALKYELEYLICNKFSDIDNLKECVNRIILIRFPVDYAYILTDAEKVKQIKSISTAVFLASGIPEPIVRYLVAGAWSYVEAVADVRVLLEGKKEPFKKSVDTWHTDIFRLGESVEQAKGSDQTVEKGMEYKDYLTILLALRGEEIYPGMLELIELNTKLKYEDFSMKDAVVGMSVDFFTTYMNKKMAFNEKGGY